MKKSKKILLAVSVICILAGLAMMAGAWLTLLDMDSGEVAVMQFEQKAHTITDPFSQIIINTVNSSVEILPSTDGSCHVICDDNEKLYHEVTVQKTEEGTLLHISQHDDWEWYESLGGLHWDKAPALKVYLPMTEYEILHASSGSGDITVAQDFRFHTVFTLSTSGNTALSNLKAEHLTARSSGGDIIIRSIQASQDVFLENVSGAMQIENLTAVNLTTGTSSGITVLEDASSEYLNMSTVSGHIRIHRGNFTGTSHIESSSGYVEISDSVCGDQTLLSVSGSVTLQTVQTTAMELHSSSGTLTLWDVICDGNAHFDTVSGEIMFSGMDAKNLELISSSGDVSGDLLTPKNFITKTSSGYVEVPPSVEDAGTCYVSTASGNINIVITP